MALLLARTPLPSGLPAVMPATQQEPGRDAVEGEKDVISGPESGAPAFIKFNRIRWAPSKDEQALLPRSACRAPIGPQGRLKI